MGGEGGKFKVIILTREIIHCLADIAMRRILWRKICKAKMAKLQNTPPLICISLNKNRLYCITSRSSKDAA